MTVSDGAAVLTALDGEGVWIPTVLAGRRGSPRVVRYRRAAERPGAGGPSETPERVLPDTVVVKFYRAAGAARTSYEAMRAIEPRLRAHGAGAEVPALAVPRALHCDAGGGYLVQESARGTPLSAVLEARGPREAGAAAGRALAALHDLPIPRSRPTKTLSDHVEDLIRPHPSALVRRFPEYGALVERAIGILTAPDDVPGPGPVPLHRDFQLRQLMFDGERLWTVDWDGFAFGDAAFDVAYFAVYLENHLPPTTSTPCRAAFLEAYGESRTVPPATAMRRCASFNYLRRACRRLRLMDHGWEAEMRAMLAKLAASLPA